MTDIIVTMTFNVNMWNESNFEPLILAIIFSFHKYPPSKLRNASFVRECEGSLQKLWKEDFLLGRNILFKLFENVRLLGSLSGNMVLELL